MEDAAIQEWKADLKEYEASKTSLSWSPSVPQVRKTHAEVKNLESSYNPILQTFNNPQIERNVQHIEKERLIETLAKNKDKALRYEQTFDIINLEDKLKGLENLPGYPEEKPPNYKARNLGNNSKTPYNIISCLDFADHHYLPPEKRPPRPIEPPRSYKINIAEHRDFNIISNKYLTDHEAKEAQDIESYKLQAAEEYWKTHDYDIFSCKFIDPNREQQVSDLDHQEHQKHRLRKYENLPNGVKYSEGALYQAICSKVVDPKRLFEIDMKSKLSKKRFEDKYDIEKEYHDRDIQEQEKEKIQALNRISHTRFEDEVKRGYDIISHTPFEGRGKKTVYPARTVQRPSVWAKAISEKSDPPQTAYVLPRFLTPNRPIRSSGFKIVT